MRFVIQRVNSASVSVDDKVIGSIGKGYLILFGAGEGDTKEMLVPYADKIAKMRIFADENEKTNLSINDVNGEILVVSQFTLYADCRKGNRPSFVHACEPVLANELYEEFVRLCRQRHKLTLHRKEHQSSTDIFSLSKARPKQKYNYFLSYS